jgi:glycerol-3-phosphate O-acyltransferase
MPSIGEDYRDITTQLIKNSRSPREVTPDNVYQPANTANRPLISRIIEDLLLEGSGMAGYEHLKELYERSQAGSSCLILMEHYSNFDIPGFYYFLEGHGEEAASPEKHAEEASEGSRVANAIVSMAGMKLNVESDFIRAFTEAYTRIVIYPARSLEAVSDPETQRVEARRSKAINSAALRHMVRMKHDGHMILVFPTGTRYRPSKPDTARVLPSVDSYLKSFDYMVFVGIAGNVLHVAEEGGMTADRVVRDVVVYTVSPVEACRPFRDRIRSQEQTGAEAKEAVADGVQQRLRELHAQAEELRAARLE